jgi:hypothetical protein
MLGASTALGVSMLTKNEREINYELPKTIEIDKIIKQYGDYQPLSSVKECTPRYLRPAFILVWGDVDALILGVEWEGCSYIAS